MGDKNGTSYEIYNIGNNHPIETVEFVRILVETLKQHQVLDESFEIDDKIVLCNAVAGDVEVTYADIDSLWEMFGIQPKFAIEIGLSKFVTWFFTISIRK